MFFGAATREINPTVEDGEALRHAIDADDIENVRSFIRRGVKAVINHVDPGYFGTGKIWCSAIDYASEHGKLEIVRLLLDEAYGHSFIFQIGGQFTKEQINVVKEISSALFKAVSYHRIDIVKVLLQDPRTALTIRDSLKRSPIYEAISEENHDMVVLFTQSPKFNINSPIYIFIDVEGSYREDIAIHVATDKKIIKTLAACHVDFIRNNPEQMKTNLEHSESLLNQLAEKKNELYEELTLLLSANTISKSDYIQLLEHIIASEKQQDVASQHPLYRVFSYQSTVQQIYAWFFTDEIAIMPKIKSDLMRLQEEAARFNANDMAISESESIIRNNVAV